MRQIRLIPFLVATMSFPPVLHAEEPVISEPAAEPALPTAAASTLLSESAYPVRWQLAEAAPVYDYSNDFARPLYDIDFKDATMISRVSSIRRLSLVTIAEIRGAQLYFGINRNGLFGLHFGASSSGNPDAHLEVVRMPYLGKVEDESDMESARN